MIPSYTNCTPLPVGDPEYGNIVQTVLATYPRACITMIDKYENPHLKQVYEEWREKLNAMEMERQKKVYANVAGLTAYPLNKEYTLYHGTKHHAVESICKEGFLPSKGRVMAYGFGIYFARNFGTSWSYSDTGYGEDPMSYVFVCSVLPGRIEGGLANQKPSSGYHSRADFPSAPNIFAIPESYMMMPKYLVRFHKTSEQTYVAPTSRMPEGGFMTERQVKEAMRNLQRNLGRIERNEKKKKTTASS